VHIPVQDEKPPSMQQIQQFCDAVQKAQDEKVVSMVVMGSILSTGLLVHT
jgi:hypothetical protein